MTTERTPTSGNLVLRVEPPPVVPRYLHRNGERTPPTEVGDYGFRGTCQGTERSCAIVSVTESFYGRLDFDLSGTDDGYAPEGFTGQWWGPIHGPWDAK